MEKALLVARLMEYCRIHHEKSVDTPIRMLLELERN